MKQLNADTALLTFGQFGLSSLAIRLLAERIDCDLQCHVMQLQSGVTALSPEHVSHTAEILSRQNGQTRSQQTRRALDLMRRQLDSLPATYSLLGMLVDQIKCVL